jgi:hypothetical protein
MAEKTSYRLRLRSVATAFSSACRNFEAGRRHESLTFPGGGN